MSRTCNESVLNQSSPDIYNENTESDFRVCFVANREFQSVLASRLSPHDSTATKLLCSNGQFNSPYASPPLFLHEALTSCWICSALWGQSQITSTLQNVHIGCRTNRLSSCSHDTLQINWTCCLMCELPVYCQATAHTVQSIKSKETIVY